MHRTPHRFLPMDGMTASPAGSGATDICSQLRRFRWDGKPTLETTVRIPSDASRWSDVQTFTNEFWTARQREAHSLHEISYRACFKPQLPRFFLDRLTREGDCVYDPFMGRGTTALESALMGRVPIGCDANPLSAMLV